MNVEVLKYGIYMQNNRFLLELKKDEVIKLLFELKNNEYWFKILRRIVESDKNTYVGSGKCQFPADCNQWFKCEREYCNADICSNGHIYRMS